VTSTSELLHGSTNQQIKSIYNYCLDAIEAKDFDSITRLMHDMTRHLQDSLDIAVILAPLSITVPVKSKIAGRDIYYTAVREYLDKLDPQRVESLLQGLR
jgi:hypothetical protein